MKIEWTPDPAEEFHLDRMIRSRNAELNDAIMAKIRYLHPEPFLWRRVIQALKGIPRSYWGALPVLNYRMIEGYYEIKQIQRTLPESHQPLFDLIINEFAHQGRGYIRIMERSTRKEIEGYIRNELKGLSKIKI